MKNKLIAVFSIIALATSILQADDIPRESLKGINEFEVIIESFDEEDAARSGLNEEVLQDHVELYLRKNGVKIVDESIQSLYVNVSLLYVKELKAFVYGVVIKFKQGVKLLISQKMDVVTTWDKGTTGLISENKAKTRIIEVIDDSVSSFLNDYLAANPKE